MQHNAAADALPRGCIHSRVCSDDGTTRLLTMKDAALKPSFKTRTFKENKWLTRRGKQNAGPQRAKAVSEGHTRSLGE